MGGSFLNYPQSFNRQRKKNLINDAATAILVQIKAMKDYARIILEGLEDDGGYGIVYGTPEGIHKAEELLKETRFLFGGGVSHISSISGGPDATILTDRS